MATTDYFPPGAFYFEVSIDGNSADVDAAFQEVSGIEVTREVEPVKAAGTNNYVHQLPGKVSYGTRLVLKRGFVNSNSQLLTWFKTSLFSDLSTNLEVKNITVRLLSEKNSPLMTWTFEKAYPVKWSISGFNAQQNALAIETIEFAYQKFTMS